MKIFGLVLTIFITFIFFSSVFNSSAKAQGVCNAGDYCLGTAVRDIPRGCTTVGGVCTQQYSRHVVPCTSSCEYRLTTNPSICDTSTCTASPGGQQSYTGTCCVNVGGGGGGGSNCNNDGICDPGENSIECPADNCGSSNIFCGCVGCSRDSSSPPGSGSCVRDTNCGTCNGGTEGAWWCAYPNGTYCASQNAVTITGKVLDSNGAPVEGVPIYVIKLSNNEARMDVTGPDGRYAVGGLISQGERYTVWPAWHRNNPANPWFPSGYAGPPLTVNCTEDAPCKVDDSWNMPTNSFNYSSQIAGVRRPIGLVGGRDCSSRRVWDGDNLHVRNPEDQRCDFVMQIDVDPKGVFDVASCTALQGWAGDKDDTSFATEVRFYVDGPVGTGTFLGSTTANNAAEVGVCEALGGTNCDSLCLPSGTSADPQCRHRFSFPLPPSVMDSSNHQIFAYVVNKPGTPGVDVQLTASPKTVNCPPPFRPLQGWIWDATGLACSANKQANKLTSSEVAGNISVSASSNGSVNWEPTNSNYSYRFNSLQVNVGATDTGICTSNFLPSGLTNFRYNLECIQGNSATITTPLCSISKILDQNPNQLHLGFRLDSTGWFKSINGDVYGGYADSSMINPSISVGIPDDTAVVSVGLSAYLIDNGFIFANEGLNVKDPLGNNKYSSPGNNSASLINAEDTWPTSYKFIAPENSAVIDLDTLNCATIFTSGALNPNNIYKGSASCINTGLTASNPLNYSTSSTGVVVIYVEDDTNDLIFNRPFVSSGSNVNKRILFISESPVIFTRSVGTNALPLNGVSPLIQASIIAKNGIRFEGTSNATSDPDNTIITEGPLVVGGGNLSSTVEFKRDRGLTNEAPAEVIYYNMKYILDLTSSERTSNILNRSGLFNIDVSWEVIE